MISPVILLGRRDGGVGVGLLGERRGEEKVKVK